MPTSEMLISVVIPTGNRIDTIEDCLKSVRWADEVLVVDSFSTDGTYELAHKYADRVLRHEYGFSALQKNWAIPQAKHEWVLIVDTDERVTSALEQEIRTILRQEQSFKGYRIPRINYFLGKPVMHAGYYPDYQLRLFMRDCGRYDLRRVHAHVLLDGECGTLRSPLIHYAHRDINQTLQNLLILMATWEAEQRSLPRRPNPKKLRSALWANILFRPIGAFLLRYIRQGGWRDGYRGLITSIIWSMYVSITYMKIFEKELELPDEWWNKDWQKRSY